jgi:hypothetical protein
MSDDLMRYDQLAQTALRNGVVREALRRVEREGLPGDHHFYITFNTSYSGVEMSDRMREKYPREMTIVLQHQFEGLSVRDDAFEVSLSFDHIPEKLVVPFEALKAFFDPAVPFGLQFEVVQAQQLAPGERIGKGKSVAEVKSAKSVKGPPKPELPASDATAVSEDEQQKVVSLDSFRKK